MAAGDRIPSGPIQHDPGGFLPEPIQRELLGEVLAGVELGAWDRCIIDWLAGWDTGTVLIIASLIQRAKTAAVAAHGTAAADAAEAALTVEGGPRLPAAETFERDVNPICGHRLRSRCDGCGTCTVCDGCYCGEA